MVAKHTFLQGLQKFEGAALMMPEHHQDYVETVPTGFELLAASESCKVEAMVSECGKILCFQFHPEYLSDYALGFAQRLLRAQPEHKISFNLGVAQEHRERHLAACTEVRLCMKSFLA